MNKAEYTCCDIDYDVDGVYITVFPSEDGFDKETEVRLLNFIKRKNIVGLDSTAVFNAIYVTPNNRVKIANPQIENKLDQDIEVKVINGGMEARAKLLPADGGEKLTLAKVLNILRREGIVYGIDHDAIEKMLDREKYYEEIPIAHGMPPQRGRDAELIYNVDFNRDAKPRILEDGSVDYRHLDLITKVSKGQVLVTLIPATEGIPGKTVLGKTVEARPGRRLRLPRGKNVILSEDGLGLLSAIDGKAEMIDGRINVYAVYEVMGDVDNSTGNIDFMGNVIVSGNVLTGFEVKSGGYIEVRGVVEGANLFAQGDVVLKQGMQGMGKGCIQSQGNVVARFIENGTVTAKVDVTAEAILHSSINCGGKVEVVGRRGLIAGGSVCAGTYVTANAIGSPMATITELEVGASPILREEYSQLVKEMDEISQELKKADQVLALLRKMESQGRLSPDKSNLRLKSIKTKLKCNQRIPPLKARIAELEAIFRGVSRGRINVRNTIYAGVKITIGSNVLYIKDEEKHVTFRREHGDIVRTSFLG